jgi:hypothetical protein
MASVSFSMTAGANATLGGITTGASAPGAGDLEIRINASNVLTRKEAYKLIDAIQRYIQYGDQTVFKP